MKKLIIMLTLLFIALVGVQHSVEASETQKYGDIYYKIVPLPNGKIEQVFPLQSNLLKEKRGS